MGERTKIEWTDHTWSPWWGCQKVSPGCKNCYALAFDKRVGGAHWGPAATRRFLSENHWRQPLKWAKAAAKAGERRRVFCASMADVFEDRAELEPERQKLWALIRDTAEMWPDIVVDGKRISAGLDWLLLTKRPQNILRMAPADILPLVWVGTTVEDQQRAEERIPLLLEIPARVRFLSMEPLLGPVDLDPLWLRRHPSAAYQRGLVTPDMPSWTRIGAHAVDWVIVGGESGPGARAFDLSWARDLRDQCRAAGVPFFCKQLGARPVFADGYDVPGGIWSDLDANGYDADQIHCMAREGGIRLADRKGGNPDEWPEDLRVRQSPEAR